ncbi:MAG: hypothetical protein ACTSPB_01510 [Candidatus Thorarchaeota archaeon]
MTRRHTVRTKHPRYKVPAYERGGKRLGFLPPERVEFPLNDPIEAEASVNRIDEYWDKSNPIEQEVMLESLKQGAIKTKGLLEGREITDPQEQMRVYKSYLIYANAYQAFSTRMLT